MVEVEDLMENLLKDYDGVSTEKEVMVKACLINNADVSSSVMEMEMSRRKHQFGNVDGYGSGKLYKVRKISAKRNFPKGCGPYAKSWVGKKMRSENHVAVASVNEMEQDILVEDSTISGSVNKFEDGKVVEDGVDVCLVSELKAGLSVLDGAPGGMVNELKDGKYVQDGVTVGLVNKLEEDLLVGNGINGGPINEVEVDKLVEDRCVTDLEEGESRVMEMSRKREFVIVDGYGSGKLYKVRKISAKQTFPKGCGRYAKSWVGKKMWSEHHVAVASVNEMEQGILVEDSVIHGSVNKFEDGKVVEDGVDVCFVSEQKAGLSVLDGAPGGTVHELKDGKYVEDGVTVGLVNNLVDDLLVGNGINCGLANEVEVGKLVEDGVTLNSVLESEEDVFLEVGIDSCSGSELEVGLSLLDDITSGSVDELDYEKYVEDDFSVGSVNKSEEVEFLEDIVDWGLVNDLEVGVLVEDGVDVGVHDGSVSDSKVNLENASVEPNFVKQLETSVNQNISQDSGQYASQVHGNTIDGVNGSSVDESEVKVVDAFREPDCNKQLGTSATQKFVEDCEDGMHQIIFPRRRKSGRREFPAGCGRKVMADVVGKCEYSGDHSTNRRMENEKFSEKNRLKQIDKADAKERVAVQGLMSSSNCPIHMLKDNYNDIQAGVARNKVRETLRLFQIICRKLTRNEEENCKTRRVDLVTASLMKKNNKWINTGNQILGVVPGVEIGDEFQYRVELSIIGLHHPYQSGIDYMKRRSKIVATSIVASGGYDDAICDSNVLIYSGQGGCPVRGATATDQKLVRGNLALKTSMDEGTPVRVIRGFDKTHGHNYTTMIMAAGFTYDGLYLVEKYWKQKGRYGTNVFMFQLRRIPGQPESVIKKLQK
ncbi:Histone-lysine N-methyltransferase, H3 lysine-9 specific protein [Thalictrum thalictroides]|uniref:Histone-lysine N-methyltransferase, H3 lysine-9 specific protein n=1 Tax=Thalictrum thalictroides TaxID=46969 RepID=A0A7J6UXY8_THATH|nr:Histone-lysine N-methyltransferase, H3 lysine-9 specific protein [Thalictrum thalictroides]